MRTSPRVVADERDVDVGDALQHLVRPDAVERGEAGEEWDGDLHDESSLQVEKRLAIVVGGDAEAADERAAHRLGAAEPAPPGDRLDGVGCRSRRAARRLGTDSGRRTGPGLAPTSAELKHADEVALAHRRPLGEHGDPWSPPGSASIDSWAARIGPSAGTSFHTGAANCV